MAKTTLERLSVVESKQDRANEDIAEIKSNQARNHKDLSDKIEQVVRAMESLDNRYPTRKEFKAVSAVLGVAVSITGVFLAILKFNN